MVFLTMTTAMVEALEKIQSLESSGNGKQRLGMKDGDAKESLHSAKEIVSDGREDEESLGNDGAKERTAEGAVEQALDAATSTQDNKSSEQSLSNPKAGNPISHGQAIDLSKELKSRGISPRTLDVLLRGARVYIPPPKPKPEPTSEYKALMARLRAEEEARSYDRMTNPTPPMETFSQIFPMSSSAHAFSSHQPTNEDDDATYQDVDRQMALIFNVLISIVACAGAIWVAARWWSTPTRLALSMSGSLLVGIAEVVVYSGYIRRVGEAKGKAKGLKEVKEVVNTWVVGGPEENEESDHSDGPIIIEPKEHHRSMLARQRKKDVS